MKRLHYKTGLMSYDYYVLNSCRGALQRALFAGAILVSWHNYIQNAAKNSFWIFKKI